MKTTTGVVDEASELLDLIARHERFSPLKTKVAVADSRYGNTANLLALAQRQIRAHVADLRSRMRNPRSEGIYPPERFAYQGEADCYTCPAEKIFIGTTLFPVAAISNIARNREPARGVGFVRSAREIAMDEP